jgi:hypothetical protein
MKQWSRLASDRLVPVGLQFDLLLRTWRWLGFEQDNFDARDYNWF